jgi:hypothetical protein
MSIWEGDNRVNYAILIEEQIDWGTPRMALDNQIAG